MSYIKIYTKKNCPYCETAKTFFMKKSLHFEEIIIDNNSTLSTEMYQHSGGRRTVPQIFINNQHIGGLDDLINLNNKNQLNDLLNNSTNKS